MENKFLNILPLEFTNTEKENKSFGFANVYRNLIELSDAINKRYEVYNIYSYVKTEYEGTKTKCFLCIEFNFELFIHKFLFSRNVITAIYEENNVCHISTTFLSISNKKMYYANAETELGEILKNIISEKEFFNLIDFLIKKSKDLNDYYVEYLANNPHLLSGSVEDIDNDKVLIDLQEEVDRNFKLYEEKFSMGLDEDDDIV